MRFKQTIFMTGFPGFIAERLVARLAGLDVQFFLLVELRFVDRAMSAVEKIAAATATPLENFALIEGDVTLPDLGIAEADLKAIRDETTDVYHLAAAYDLGVSKDIAYRVNLEGTQNVNEFARLLPQLRRYNYVSTCYVAGKRKGHILESELEHDAGFRNFYEETKYLAEIGVERLKTDLPVTIFRPSVVVGDSETGETAKYDGIYYLINYLRKSPGLFRFINVGNADVRLNLVPVDFVVEGIAALSNDESTIGKTIALADPEPLTTKELFDVIVKIMTGKESAIAPPPILVEKFLSLPVSPALTGLPLSGVPYFFLSQTYDTSMADEFLKEHGVRCPNFRDYAGNLLEFVQGNPSL